MISLQEMLVLMGIATTPSVADVPTIKPDVLIKQQQEEISILGQYSVRTPHSDNEVHNDKRR